MTTLEEYKAKKIAEFERKFPIIHRYCEDQYYSCPKAYGGCFNDNAGEECDCGAEKEHKELIALISQTIDELKLPNKKGAYTVEEYKMAEFEVGYLEGWNACIAEAERMRDLSIKTKE